MAGYDPNKAWTYHDMIEQAEKDLNMTFHDAWLLLSEATHASRTSNLIFDHTSKYFCFKIPTFCFWLEALIPCLPHSFTSIFALKHPGISTRNICRWNSWNTCVETGRGLSGFCEPYWWSLQLLVWRWPRLQGHEFLPRHCELLQSETAAVSHSPLRPRCM